MLAESIKVLNKIFQFLLIDIFLVERTTIRRMRQVQNWLQSKPSMWIHNLAAEKVFFNEV